MKNVKIIVAVLAVYCTLSTGYILISSLSKDSISRSDHEAVVSDKDEQIERLEAMIKGMQGSMRNQKEKQDDARESFMKAVEAAKNTKQSGESYAPRSQR